MRLIQASGAEQWHMSTLGKRADVSTRTVYNIFGSRERLIAQAVEMRLSASLPKRQRTAGMEASLERLIATLEIYREIKNCISALMSIYFSAATTDDLRAQIDSRSRAMNESWLRDVAARNELIQAVTPNEVADDLVKFEFATILDWAQGRVDDADIVRRMTRGYISLAAGAMRGPSHRKARRLAPLYS